MRARRRWRSLVVIFAVGTVATPLVARRLDEPKRRAGAARSVKSRFAEVRAQGDGVVLRPRFMPSGEWKVGGKAGEALAAGRVLRVGESIESAGIQCEVRRLEAHGVVLHCDLQDARDCGTGNPPFWVPFCGDVTLAWR